MIFDHNNSNLLVSPGKTIVIVFQYLYFLLFSKCLRAMVKFWWQNSIDIVLYLDDVFHAKIPESRIIDLILSIGNLLLIFPNFTASQLAQVTGKIISLSPVLGNITRLMTVYCYMVIEIRTTWDRCLCLTFIQEVLRELLFWRDNARNNNFRLLVNFSHYSNDIFWY